MHSVCITSELEFVERAQDVFQLCGVKHLEIHLCDKWIAPLWNYLRNIVILLLQPFLQTVIDIIDCDLKFAVDQLEHLEFLFFSGFVVHIIANAGLVAGATFTGSGL